MPISDALRNTKVKFLNCELNCNSGHLFVDEKDINLEPLIFQFLLLLIEQQGQIVSKQQVISSLWQERTPTDEALRAMVKKAREALKDNARNPQFIKTIPTKGYLFIPSVEVKSTVVKSWFQQNIKSIVLAGLVVTSLLAALSWWLINTYFITVEPEVKVEIVNENIARLDNRVNTYYTNKGLLNIIANPTSSNESNILLIDNIDNDNKLMLSFEEPIHDDVWYSTSHQTVLVMRKDKSGFFKVKLSESVISPNIFKFDFALPVDEKIIGINDSVTNAFLFNESNGVFSLFDIDTGEQSTTDVFDDLSERVQLIIGNLLSEVQTTKLTSQTETENEQDKLENIGINISPVIFSSPTTNYFAVLINYSSRASNSKGAELLFYETLNQSELYASKSLENTTVSNLLWDKEGTRTSYIDEIGKLFSFQLSQQSLTTWRLGGTKLNNLLADCGNECFVVASKLGIPKVVQTHLSFSKPIDTPINGSLRSYAAITKSNTKSRSEYLPLYKESALYFVAEISPQTNRVGLYKREADGMETLVFEFNEAVNIQEFTINEEESMIAGVSNQRPFLLNLQSKQFQYINLNAPIIKHLIFDGDQLNYFGSWFDNSEKLVSSSDQSQSQAIASGVFSYNTRTKGNQRLIENAFALVETNLYENTDTDVNRLASTLKISIEGEVSVRVADQTESISIANIQTDCIRCWQLVDNYFYYLGTSDTGTQESVLYRVDMLSLEKSAMPLPKTFYKGEFLNQFSINPTTGDLALLQRQDLQTELTRITGMQQVY